MYDLTDRSEPWLRTRPLPTAGGLAWRHVVEGNFDAAVPGTPYRCFTRGLRFTVEDRNTQTCIFVGELPAFEAWLVSVRPIAAE